MDEEKVQILSNNDPLGDLVRDRLQWSPLTWGLVVLAANAVIQLGSAALFGALYSPGEPPGLLQDIGAVYVILVMQPVLNGYYVWTILGAR